MWEVCGFWRRWGPGWETICSCLATCSCFPIKRRHETLKMGTIYFSPSFLISSLLKYLSKYEAQKEHRAVSRIKGEIHPLWLCWHESSRQSASNLLISDWGSSAKEKNLLSWCVQKLQLVCWIKNIQLNNKKNQTIRLITGQRIWTDIFPKKIYEWPTDTWKNVQHHESSGQCN